MAKVIVGGTDITRATYKNTAGSLTDPTSVVGWVKKPDGTVTDTGIIIDNPSVGIYDVAVPIDQAGLWFLEITATGVIETSVLEKRICAVWSSVA